MEFTLARNQLAEAVVHAANGIPANPDTPIRAGMLVSVTDGGIRFTGSDGVVTFTAFAANKAASPGGVILPGKLFTDVVKALPDRDVIVVSGEGKAVLTCGRISFTFRELTGDYPLIPGAPQACGTMSAEGFREAAVRLPLITSRDASTPAYTGILLEPVKDYRDILAFVATDSYRLGVYEAEWVPSVHAGKCLIPGWALEKFARTRLENKVSLGWDDHLFTIQSGDFSVTASQIASGYPKWRDYLTDEARYRVDPSRAASSLRLARLAIADDSPAELSFREGNLYLSAGTGTYSDVLPCDYPGEEVTALVGWHILLDGMIGCEGNDTFIGFTDKAIHLMSGSFRYVFVTRRRI